MTRREAEELKEHIELFVQPLEFMARTIDECHYLSPNEEDEPAETLVTMLEFMIYQKIEDLTEEED